MKRFLKVLSVFVLSCSLISFSGYAKPKKKPQGSSEGKVNINCPSPAALKARGIKACPDTGCGTVDPNLNLRKNIGSTNATPEDMDFEELQDATAFPDPVPGFAIGDSREKLTALGEGKMIRVVAYALAARKGSKESCNCGLSKPADTDNHIVLVNKERLKVTAKATPAKPASGTKKAVPARSAAYNTLKLREEESETAEFTPRVRLAHPNLAGARLQALIVQAAKQALLVRVTGLLMFDSQHSLGGHLPRHNNWEIHPVFHLEYCPKNKTCTKGSDANWKSLEQ